MYLPESWYLHAVVALMEIPDSHDKGLRSMQALLLPAQDADASVLFSLLAAFQAELPACAERLRLEEQFYAAVSGNAMWCLYCISVAHSPGGFTLIHHKTECSHALQIIYLHSHLRRQQLGLQVARTLICQNPGQWELRVSAENIPGTAFCRAIADRLMGGQYHEIWHATPQWRGFIQQFIVTDAHAQNLRAAHASLAHQQWEEQAVLIRNR